MKASLKVFVRVAPLSTLLLLGVLLTPFIRVNHASPSMKAMMSKPEASSNCVTICTRQTPFQFNDIQRKQAEEDEEPSPEPAELYYLAFMGVGWTTAITVATTYLIKYLHWRPPDIFSLYSYYRI